MSLLGVRNLVFFVEVRPFVAISEYTGVISCEAVIYQKVTLRLLVFHLVEDIGSWDAENEGKSLFLQFK